MGEGRAKAESFLRHLEPLRGALEAYCRRWLRDRNAVADVLQSAVANAFRDFHLYAEGTCFRAWMFRYVHLELQNWNRKYERSRHAELRADPPAADAGQTIPEYEPLVEALLEDADAVLDHCEAELAAAVRALGPLERAVLLLQAVGEFKYREIAEIVQVPIGTVMSSLARARQRLRRRLAEYARQRGVGSGE